MRGRAVAVVTFAIVLAGCVSTTPNTPPAPTPVPLPAPARPAAGPPDAGAAYDALLDRARQRPPDVDFGALRMAYARSERYRPYSRYPDEEPPMKQALDARDWRIVLEIAESALARNYVRARPHFWAMTANGNLGRAAAAAHHRAVMEGLLRSIAASGDGRTPATAMVVIDVQEEYDVMTFLGVTSRVQGLVHEAGRAFDRHDVEGRDGARSTVYFDVSLPLSRAPFGPPPR
jgi:hypothetical protein